MSRTDDEREATGSRAEGLPACPACGASARRARARFCATCGRNLRARGYRPADGLRASYRWQTGPELSRPGREAAGTPSGVPRSERLSAAPRPRPRAADANPRPRRDEIARPRPDETSRRARLTSPNRRPRAHRRNAPTARAYVLMAYALVPFVGIVLCPAAVVCGAVGLRRAGRERHPAAAREAGQSIVYAVLLTGAQALLWLISFGLTGWP
ncbi:MAG: hypothetical protein LC800_16830 [Acidobacteria bacterium]|nr:hypothetical protein [Acidobacteriota bacterium]